MIALLLVMSYLDYGQHGKPCAYSFQTGTLIMKVQIMGGNQVTGLRGKKREDIYVDEGFSFCLVTLFYPRLS